MRSPSSGKQINTSRLFMISVGFCVLTILTLSYLFVVQIKNHKSFTAQAQSIQETEKKLTPKRGIIYFQDKDKNKIPVAINKAYKLVYSVPTEIQENKSIETTAKTISNLLNVDYNTLVNKFSKVNDKYEIIYPKLEDKNLIKSLESLKLKGVYMTEEYSRFYPLEELGCHMIGFVGETKEGKGAKIGQYGLEKFYNDVLEGQAGSFKGIKDAFGRLIRSLTSQESPANDGSNIIATIDKNVQYKADEEVNKLLQTRLGTSGSIIVMEPKTGKIIAMSN
jgi:cell division protein FtsI (penicillin-binding protein 3)